MLILNGGADKGSGQRGDDGIRGRGGDDLLKGGRGGDYFGELVGGSGDDRLLGGEGRDQLIDRLGANVYRGGLGNDLMEDFGRSDDFFFGGRGGSDHVFWAGFQPVSANLTTGQTTGFGEDTLVGIEELEGGAGPDTLIGDDLGNALFGNSGDDHLEGRGGDDVLDGSEGTDFLDGGAGTQDRCSNGETVLNCEL